MSSSTKKVAGSQDQRGRDASLPLEVPAKGWLEILKRSWREAGDDNVGIIAAGVAFYGFLALVPLLGVIVLSDGLIVEPQTVLRNIGSLTSVMPADAAKLIGEHLMNVVKTSGSKNGFGLVLALVECIGSTFYLAARTYGGQWTTLLRDPRLIEVFEELPPVRTAWS